MTYQEVMNKLDDYNPHQNMYVALVSELGVQQTKFIPIEDCLIRLGDEKELSSIVIDLRSDRVKVSDE